MKKEFIEQRQDGEEFYREATAAAYAPCDGYQRVIENLEQSMILVREEMNRKQKMVDVMREALHIEGFENKHKHAKIYSLIF